MKKQALFIILIILMAVGIGIWREQGRHAPPSFLNLAVGTLLSSPQHLPAFALEDATGSSFTKDSLKNRWSLLFFGYTSCPNICPATIASLENISQRLSRLPAMQYVFITLDPAFDNKKQLIQYFQQTHFSHKILGVTGEKKSILSLSQQLGVHVEESQNNDRTNINHSGTLFLVDPDGNLAALFTDTAKPHAIAHDIKEIMHHYAVNHSSKNKEPS